MKIYEAIFNVGRVEVYATNLYTNHQAVIDEVTLYRREILRTLCNDLDGIEFEGCDPDGTESDGTEANAMYDRFLAALANGDTIDDDTTYGAPVFVAMVEHDVLDDCPVLCAEETTDGTEEES